MVGTWHRHRRVVPDSGLFNGIVGFKPTQRRRAPPGEGGGPLSFTLDSFGPLRAVGCCAVLDAVLADEAVQPLQTRPIKGMRLAVPTTVALDELDDEVAATLKRRCENSFYSAGSSCGADRGAGIPRRCSDEYQRRFSRGKAMPGTAI